MMTSAAGEEQVDAHLPSIDPLLKPRATPAARVSKGSAYGTVTGRRAVRLVPGLTRLAWWS